MPGSLLTTSGSSRWGARRAASANLDENSPNTRCSLRRSIRPKVATSQNAVEPPLPSTTSQPSGSPNSSVSPSRIEPTTSRTGAWRWDVPSQASPAAASAATASGRTFEGPQPKRPSPGSSSKGIDDPRGVTVPA